MAVDSPPRERRTPVARRNRTGWWVVAVLALGIALVSLGTYAQGPLQELADEGTSVAASFVDAPTFVQVALYVHIVAGSIALALGPLQFVTWLRNRWPRLHRMVGRTYVGTVLIAALMGLVIAPYNSAGLLGVFGFGLLGVLWAVTTLLALQAARQRRFRDHQAWMIRSYALTFAAPMLRLWVLVLITVQPFFLGIEPDPYLAFERAYIFVPFLCWVPNLIFAEWLVWRRGLPLLWERAA